MKRWFRPVLLSVAVLTALVVVSIAFASTPGGDVRLTNDYPGGGYVSVYTLATGNPYTDAVLQECSIARGRQNEPSVAVDPRNTNVLIGSSNDYCGTYAGSTEGNFVPIGPIWLGYYRSENAGASFVSSLVPGYPGDTSPYADQAHVRTASAGDPVIAWDNYGRVYMGSESSDDPSGSKKTFGDVWVATFDNPDGPDGDPQNDGKRFVRSEIVAHGSSAPNLLGVFHDKTAIEVDRTGGACDGNVYFAWSRFNGFGNNAIYISRSTDHGKTWSQPDRVTVNGVQGVQNPDIAITGNGHVYLVFREFRSFGASTDSIDYVKSTDCGKTYGPPQVITTFTRYRPIDTADPEPVPPQSSPDDVGEEEGESREIAAFSRDCGDFDAHCLSGYTFFRVDAVGTQVRATADQLDPDHEWVYIVYDPTKPGTIVNTDSSYFSVTPGKGGQAGIYFVRLNGANNSNTTPKLIDDQAVGHQIYPDISADGGVLHVLWWDSRNDPCYSPKRPIGNCADRTTVPALDVYAARSNNNGGSWTGFSRLTDVTSNPNYEQFSNRTVPFAGDYLWITSLGDFSYGTWTDWRNTVQGVDPREAGEEDEDGATADVKQCRTFDEASGTWSGDQCPHAGGLDQDIYGDYTP